jgi:hypothetical protein
VGEWVGRLDGKAVVSWFYGLGKSLGRFEAMSASYIRVSDITAGADTRCFRAEAFRRGECLKCCRDRQQGVIPLRVRWGWRGAIMC